MMQKDVEVPDPDAILNNVTFQKKPLEPENICVLRAVVWLCTLRRTSVRVESEGAWTLSGD